MFTDSIGHVLTRLDLTASRPPSRGLLLSHFFSLTAKQRWGFFLRHRFPQV